MRKLLFLLFFLFLSPVLMAQREAPKSIKGTYQIEMLATREKPLIPNNLEELVQKNRKQKEVSYYRLADNVRIKILPKSEISKPGFKPLEPEIIHVY